MDSTSDLTPDEKREMRGLLMTAAKREQPVVRSWARPLMAMGLVLVGGLGGVAIYSTLPTTPTTIGDEPPAPTPSSQEPPSHKPVVLEAFDRAATPADALPTDLPDYAYENVREGTSRFIGEQDSISFYVARGSAESPVCLLTYPTGDQEDWSVTCGGVPLKATTGSIAIAWVHPVGADTKGWTDLDANLSVKTGW